MDPSDPSPFLAGDRPLSGAELWQWRQAAQAAAIATDVNPYEVDWLLQALAGLDRLTLQLGSFRSQEAIALTVSLAELDDLWQRRLRDRQPIQYLAGRTPWREFSLRVSPAVLIPRPDTEEIIDLACALTTEADRIGHWVDLGTGSGAIALGLAQAFPQAQIHAIDCSPEALAIAQQNAVEHGLRDRIQFFHGSWFDPLDALRGQLRGMVSNPPYIPRNLLSTLQPEVVHHEPTLALDGGEDGLDAIRHLMETAPAYLQPGGLWLVELMVGQAIAVTQLLQHTGRYTAIHSHRDLSGNDRFVSARLKMA
ncbi:peptide chain release factor N(5)-glutamine methyltransferase [Vacuolonema iberomarrocanum]|uniref:peptide chain release factor N(5)-glutamine methyltransferase n=1 Tax=Vacuolonema iberomarrocanum TaxID=3454632 RepID=UPI0019D8D06F|nr:peptide chain release factor N(5)-glutamine methyltransferase [filamentous cyanobacterium LEGE 07170]